MRRLALHRGTGGHPVLKAKLSRPNLGGQVLDRPHLIRALIDHAQRPLTLVVADAGYGKTTLLASFARAMPRPVVWYSLMGSDADPVVFGRYLLEGFRREWPRFGRDFHRALDEARPGLASAEMLAGTLLNELATLKGPPCLLVLDDFQEVAGNPQVVAMVDTLLRHLPPRVRVLAASRTMPPLALERMRAKGDLFELDSSHLRFAREELARLFGDVYRRPLADDELDALVETTMGWPTAVHLVFQTLERSERATLKDVLADVHASSLALHDYLSSEVYARLDPEARAVLERTAALTRFDADLATALGAGDGNVSSLLDHLARRGLLRTYGAGAQASYECHDLVRRFIRAEIEHAGGAGAWRSLEADAGDALAARGEPERALRHLLAAGRDEQASALLRDLAPRLMQQGRAAALLQYLNDLGAARLGGDLALTVALADARQALGQWDEAEAVYQRALAACREAGDPRHECLALVGLGKVLNLRGRYEQVLGMSERGLAIAQDLGIEVRARLLQMKAGAHFYLGQYRAAVRVLDELRDRLPAAGASDLLAPVLHNLAGAYAAQGRFHEATREFRAALAQVRGTASPRAPLYLSNLAFHLADLGDLAEARQAAEEGLQAAQRFSNRAQETACYEALAQILAQGGDLDGALTALRRAEELNAELRVEVIALNLLALRGRIFCARGQYRRAVEFLTQAIDRLDPRPDAPQLTEFTATLAWCELRAGRVRVARDLLQPLAARADAGENDYQRMRVHYWLAESLLALGDRKAVDAHLAAALGLVRERGYAYFLRVQAREEPAPLLHALARGIEVDLVSAALVEPGAAVEGPLLALLPGAPPAVAEAAIAVLSEVGESAALAALERIDPARRTLQPAVRIARRHIRERLARGAGADRSAELPRLVLFGPPQLLIEGRPVPAAMWRAQRAFHVLLYLALHPRGAGRDELIERFWPGRQAAAGRRNFHPTFSYLRKVLPAGREPAVLRDGEFYRLNPAYRLTCDAWEFDRALEEARAGRDAAARRRALEGAAAMTARPFLEGVYGAWAEEHQTRVRDRTEKLLLDLGALCVAAGDHAAALAHFRRAAELDEFREATRVAVIESLVRTGNRRAAIAEYDKLKALLRGDLAVDPLPETERAVQALLATAPSSAAAGTVLTG
ncbi:MAG: tetratricopeptide repeat protein [Candidatus Eisenbacteria bacterium]|nr:tetratricopeptide repeat protein [Candidatus Eisenbacteria bacterium]